ncbi:hypothetical protein [Amycolatopsis sp. ATCC 39116]|nr:hypothetical protein [Amycolatopsis sp. ATCC 39116]
MTGARRPAAVTGRLDTMLLVGGRGTGTAMADDRLPSQDPAG